MVTMRCSLRAVSGLRRFAQRSTNWHRARRAPRVASRSWSVRQRRATICTGRGWPTSPDAVSKCSGPWTEPTIILAALGRIRHRADRSRRGRVDRDRRRRRLRVRAGSDDGGDHRDVAPVPSRVRRHRGDAGAEHAVRERLVWPLPARAAAGVSRRPGRNGRRARRPARTERAVSRPVTLRRPPGKPTLAVWKFASCDGCQLSLLDCEDELLAIGDSLRIASFPEASSAIVEGPYDLSLVEGSITTPGDIDRIHEIRRASTTLVTIGACATAGGIQALRNGAEIDDFIAIVYAHPQLHLDACDVDADRRPRRRRLRAPGMPDRSRPTRRGRRRLSHGPTAAHRVDERVHRVQGAADCLCDGRRRDAVPRAGHARGVRRALSVVPAWVLRMLRSGRNRRHRRARSPARPARPRRA